MFRATNTRPGTLTQRRRRVCSVSASGTQSSSVVYRKYSTFSRVDRASASSTAQVRQPMWKAAAAKYSLGMKPAKMGMPTMDRAPTVNTQPAAGSRWAAARRLLKSLCPPEVAARSAPDRNSMGLVRAWDTIWNSTAARAAWVPMPRPM